MKKKFTFIMMLAFISLSSAFAQVPSNGLVGYWPFNGNANDESGNNNNGTVTGATLTTDRFGNANSAYSLDGINNYISVPSSSSIVSFPNGQTLSYWIKISAFPSDGKEHYIIDKSDNIGSPSTTFYQTWITNVNDIGYRYAGASGLSSQGTTIPFSKLTLNNWLHICITTDLTVTKAYINGLLVCTYSHYATIGTTSNPLKFGQRNGTSSAFAPYNGDLDDIRIYNRVLNQTEVTTLYNASNNSTSTICQTIGNDSLSLRNNGYITGPDLYGTQPIHTETKWIKISGTDSLYVNTFQHRLYDKSKIYNKDNNLIWEWDGESVPATTWYSRNHIVFVGGNDSVRIEFYQGYPSFCLGHLQITKMICGSITNNINQIESLTKLNIYPNPTNENIIIDIETSNILINYTLQITNTLGQIVLTNKINNRLTNLDLNGLPCKGIYFVHITDVLNTRVETRKIVVQ